MKKQMIAMALACLTTQTLMAKPLGEFSIANRGGSVSFLNSNTADVSVDSDLLSTEVSEPMYMTPLGNSKGQRMVAFADRTRNMLSVIDGKTKALLSEIEISKGAFHQFSHPLMGLRVAVATDVEKGMDLIQVSDDGKTLTKRRYNIPQSLTSGNPHDVVMDRHFAYLTVKDVKKADKTFDVLLQIDLKNLKLVKVKKFSQDIHLFSPVRAGFFAVVEQQTGDLNLLQKGTMKTLDVLNVAKGVHGISGSENGQFLFIADIDEAAGSKAVYALEVTAKGAKVLNSVALNYGTAHNVAVDDRGDNFTVVITHSGPKSIFNSVLNFSKKAKKLKLEKEVRTGINPFGLTFF